MFTSISIIVPCYNESRTIGLLLKAIHRQTHPLDDIEVVIADGMSTDGTREAIEEFSSENPDLAICVVDNPDRIIPAALNRAIRAARGEVILRLDAHSIPYPNYVAGCLASLERTGAANVGGVWEIKPSGEGWVARSIAVAAAHPLGAGGARYRTSGQAGAVETVPFGAYRREWFERVGLFNESLLSNEDYEFNVRLHRAGGVIWFDPTIRSVYFARGSLTSLAKQYARYGYWKGRMLVRHAGSLRWRQALPPLFVLTTLLLGIMAPLWRPANLLLRVQLGLYGTVTILAGLVETIRKRDFGLLVGFPLALWTMHFAWGGAFLWSLFTVIFGGRRESG